jgi:hypothetical protein
MVGQQFHLRFPRCGATRVESAGDRLLEYDVHLSDMPWCYGIAVRGFLDGSTESVCPVSDVPTSTWRFLRAKYDPIHKRLVIAQMPDSMRSNKADRRNLLQHLGDNRQNVIPFKLQRRVGELSALQK